MVHDPLPELVTVEVPAEGHICVVRRFAVAYIGVFPFRVECSRCAWASYSPDEDAACDAAARHYDDEAASDARWGRLYRTAAAGR